MEKLNIKRLLLMVGIIVISLIVTGCIEHELTAEELAKEIAQIIEHKDEQAMRNFFANDAFDEMSEEDFQKGIEYAFSLMQGEVVEVEFDGIGRETESMGGNIQFWDTSGSYKVITTENEYLLFFNYVYDFNRSFDAKGSYRIIFVNHQDENSFSGILKSNAYFGLYHPDWKNRPEGNLTDPIDYLCDKYLFPTDIDKSRWVAQEVDFYFDVDDEYRKDIKNFNTRGVLKTKDKSANIFLGIWPDGHTRVDEIISTKKVIDRASGKEKTEYDFERGILEAYLFDSNENSFKLKIDEEYQYIFGDEPIKEITFVRKEMPKDDESESLDISKDE